MNEKEIRSVLHEALEEEIPSSQVDLWPAVKASLVAGNQNRVQQGETMKTERTSRIPRLAAVAAVLVTLLVAALLTPQGRALSQTILQFFTQADETTVPVPPPQTEAGETDLAAPTAAPPAPLISVSEAEAQAGFDVAELPFVPEGLIYLGARMYGEAVSLEYQTEGLDGHLHIVQSRSGFNESEWDRVPAQGAVPVKIGDVDAEFIQGRFVVYAGETEATWEPDAPSLRLRWEKDGILFEMTKSGYAEELAYLDQAALIELAENLVGK
jgi:hypothetical protein